MSSSGPHSPSPSHGAPSPQAVSSETSAREDGATRGNPPDVLTLPVEEMRRLGYQVVDMLVEHFAGIRDKPVTRLPGEEEMAALLPGTEHAGCSEAAGLLTESLGREFSERPTPLDDLLRE